LAGEAVKEPVALMELGPKPMPVIRAKSIAFAETPQHWDHGE
jgi:hypothetical protein